MINNSIQNILLKCDESYLYISYVANEICKISGLIVSSKTILDWDVENIFIGTNKKEKTLEYANCAIKKGIVNAVVVNGANAFPFICPFEESIVLEAWKNKIFSYTVDPKVLGIKEASKDEIRCENIEHSKITAREILSSKLKDARFDTAMINCAFALYISKKANSVTDGINLFKKIIQTYDLK